MPKSLMWGVITAGILILLAGFLYFDFEDKIAGAQVECKQPQIYTMQFGVEINRFLVLDDRLHLVVPLPITGDSGKVLEVEKVYKKAKKGKCPDALKLDPQSGLNALPYSGVRS